MGSVFRNIKTSRYTVLRLVFAAGLSCPGKFREGLRTGPKLPVSSNREGPGTKKSQDIASPKVLELECTDLADILSFEVGPIIFEMLVGKPTTLPTPCSWLLSVAF